MQKIRLFFSFFLLFFFLFGIFSPIAFSFSEEDIYDYREFREKIKVESSQNTIHSPFFETHLAFSSPRTTFTLVFPEYKNKIPPTDLRIEWVVDATIYERTLDIEDEGENIATFPLVVEKRNRIGFRIYWTHLPREVELITARHDVIGESLTFVPWIFSSYVAASTSIVSRKEWWADESLRYVSVSEQARRISAWKERWETPRIIEISGEEKIKNEQSAREMNEILAHDPEATTTISRMRYEYGNKLIWPIQKTKKVNRIIIHHTAESLDKTADDEVLLRAIYVYHTRTKGWWDIGYHYIVGQRGKIYEGRAWGDYVEWAHVYGNNYGSIGIALIGNYNQLNLNRDQKAGLVEAVTYVATKYGIDVSESVTGAYPCGWSECIWKAVSKNRLAWHRDFGSTSCPGNNLYNALPDIRNTVVWKVWSIKPILNMEQWVIEKVPSEDAITYVVRSQTSALISPFELSQTQNSSLKPLSTTSSSSQKKDVSSNLVPSIDSLLRIPKIPSPVKSSLLVGPDVRVRLSYPDTKNLLQIESATSKMSVLHIGKRKIQLKPSDILSVAILPSGILQATVGKKKYRSSLFSLEWDIFRILSWDRIPSWDTARKYNDNLFRSRIVIRTEWGKLLITNELPLEQYLKWMGEVSEWDAKSLPEKAKVMIVAGRSYALYYLDKTLPEKKRKFPGKPYDISDNPDESQVYKGYNYEQRSPTYTRFVDETNREVVWYKNDPIKVPYSSTPWGRTLSYKEYCEINNPEKTNCEDIDYLQSVDDPGSAGKPKNGHGYGISGDGARYFALQGWNYTKIIEYYLKWVEIKKK